MIMHCRYSLLRACLLALLISSGNVSAGVSPDNTVQDAISSATEPLHREIESLKEQLENIEARHDTLEAATEQFRIKAKSLKVKLQEEKNSYDNLMSLKADAERKLQEETVSVSERLEESESRAASLEKSLEIALAEKKELDSLRHNEAKKRIEDSNRWEERMGGVNSENKDLANTIKQRDDELAEAKSTYFKLRQELFVANEQLREMEKDSRLTLWSVYWVKIRDSEGIATAWDQLKQFERWIKQDLFPVWQQASSELIDGIKEEAIRLYDGTSEFIATASEAKAIDSENLRGQKTHQDAVDRLTEIYRGSVATLATLANGPLKEYLRNYKNFHQATVHCLESAAVAMSSYYILQHEGNPSSWIYTCSLFVKAHSGSIVFLAEVLFALILIDFAVTSILSWFRYSKSARPLEQASWKRASLKREPEQPSLKRASVKREPSKFSLLRQAGGSISRRHNNWDECSRQSRWDDYDSA
jgi:hypothetical protein